MPLPSSLLLKYNYKYYHIFKTISHCHLHYCYYYLTIAALKFMETNMPLPPQLLQLSKHFCHHHYSVRQITTTTTTITINKRPYAERIHLLRLCVREGACSLDGEVKVRDLVAL